MLTALLTIALQTKAEIGPIPNAGTNGHFQVGVQQVSEHLQSKKFKEAGATLGRLPKLTFSYRLDLKSVPKGRQTAFVAAARKAAAVIEDAFPEAKIVETSKGEDVRISFEEALPRSQESGLPQGAVFFDSLDPTEPAIEAVIGLTRTSGKVSVEDGHVLQEIFYAFGQFLGIASRPGSQGISCRTDALNVFRPVFLPQERVLVLRNMETVGLLNSYISKKQSITAAKIQLKIDRTAWDIGRVGQGTRPEMLIGINNQGNVPLEYTIVPDCSCFLIRASGRAEPGQSSTIAVTMDTSAFGGPQLKKLYIYTNDPSQSTIEIPVTGYVEPAYRFLVEESSEHTAYVDENGGTIVRYLAISDGQDIVPHDMRVSGVSASVAFEPWSGELADPEMGEGPKLRKGYKITMLVSPQGIKGRVNATLSVITNNEGFKSLLYGLILQHGIAASPATVYFGEIKRDERIRAWTILSRPGRPFKVTEVASSSPDFEVKVEQMPGGTYKLIVEYLGKGFPGTIVGVAKITTDSPDQKTIEIPIEGIIR